MKPNKQKSRGKLTAVAMKHIDPVIEAGGLTRYYIRVQFIDERLYLLQAADVAS